MFTEPLNLVVSESLTNERMWTKSVPTDPILVPLNTTNAHNPQTVTLYQIVQNEPDFHNAVVRVF